MSDEFYIGYEPDMPPRLAARIHLAARALIACALLLPATLVLSQGRFAPAVFEFGETRTFEGTLVEYPYPALIVADTAGDVAYWLVGRGKHGAAALVRGRDGRRVRLSGSLIQREADAMLEVGPDAIMMIDDGRARAAEPLRSLGPIVVQGEIVDSKCHLGVMKPGEGATHRDCAVRCLLGSVPPMFVLHDRSGRVNDRSRRLSLVSQDARPFADADRWAGRAVTIRGELLQRGAQRFLAASPSAIRVLD
jgi:hypothetical protein